MSDPRVSVVIPTFNNLPVLRDCLARWERFTSDQAVELLVIEDGCRDGTPEFLRDVSTSEWGAAHLRWFHEDDVHELRCTNRGFREARGELLLVWQDDMLLDSRWLLPELVRTFDRRPEIGLVSLSRGLDCYPLDEPIDRWEDLIDWRRLRSTIGRRPWNWFRLVEVDGVIRPWAVRQACIDRVGPLDEAFELSEWDEADLCFRIRRAGWFVATHGYERAGAYRHLGSTTVKTPSPAYLAQVLANGRLFHSRWDTAILGGHARRRRVWWRTTTFEGWVETAKSFGRRSRAPRAVDGVGRHG